MVNSVCYFCSNPLALEPNLHGCASHSYHHFCYNQWLSSHPSQICPLCEHDVSVHPEDATTSSVAAIATHVFASPLELLPADTSVPSISPPAALESFFEGSFELEPVPHVLDFPQMILAAAYSDDFLGVQHLLNQGLEITLGTRIAGITAAIVHNNIDLFNLFFDGHAAEIPHDGLGDMIQSAAFNNASQIMNRLLSNDPYIPNLARAHAICASIQNWNLEMFNQLYDGHEEALNSEFRGHAVIIAAEYNHTEFVERLLTGNFEISLADRVNALESAAFYGNLTLFNLLYNGYEQDLSSIDKGRLVVIGSSSKNSNIIQRLAENPRPISEYQRLHALIYALLNLQLDLVDLIQNMAIT